MSSTYGQPNKKLIFHVDVNNAFLSWTAVKLLSEDPKAEDPRLIPSVVGGDESRRHGVVLAKSTPAKAYGIVTGESLMEARRKCPFIRIYPPDRAFYRRCSDSFYEILRRYTDIVERASIDECFADMSAYPSADPLELALEIRKTVSTELGFTVNVGISDSKVLAKIASDFSKPDKTHTLYRSELREKLWPLPVSSLLFVGPSTVKKLNGLGVRTVGDLASCDRDFIKRSLGAQGAMLLRYALGEDDSEVRSQREPNKGYSASVTLERDITDIQEAEPVLLRLCEELSERLRKDELYARTVTVTIRYADFVTVNHQAGSKNATDLTRDIYRAARKLFSEKWNGRPVRLIGVGLSNLCREKYSQYSLFEDTDSYDKNKKAEETADLIKKRFGEAMLVRGSLLEKRKMDRSRDDQDKSDQTVDL